MIAVYKKYQIEKVNTLPFRPQTNGLVERFNRVIVYQLKKLVCQQDWKEHLAAMIRCYRGQKHPSNQTSPHEVFIGRKMSIVVGLRWIVKTKAKVYKRLEEERNKKLKSHRQKMEKNRNKDHMMEGEYKKNDEVLLKRYLRISKIEPTWLGYFIVDEIISPLIVKIRERKILINVRDLKKYKQRPLTNPIATETEVTVSWNKNNAYIGYINNDYNKQTGLYMVHYHDDDFFVK